MTIKATYQALQTVAASVLPTFTFYGMYRSQYNAVNTIQDNTLIIEPPRQWPLNARDTCKAKFTAKVWIGVRQSIKPETDGVMEYPPFNEIDVRDTLVTAANTLVNGINSYTSLQVVNELDEDSLIATLYDVPEGVTTNWQAWVHFSVDIVSYGSSGLYVPVVYAPGLSFVTQYTLQNGDTLPTGVRPDVLYIETDEINTDIETVGHAVTVPDGYMLRRGTYYITTDDIISNIKLNNTTNGDVFLNDADYDYECINAIMVNFSIIPVTSYTLTAVGVGLTSTIRAIFEFQNVQK